MSSSAFFIEAAANTVRVLSSAVAGEWAARSTMTSAAIIPARRYMMALSVCSQARGSRAGNQALVGSELRQAEAPFRQSGGFTIRPDIAPWNLAVLLARS